MMVYTYLRTIDLARAGQVSVQQVRNYEANSFIPPAERGANGYRRYTQKHLAALKTARSLVAGYGWPLARAIMQTVHEGRLSDALALVDDRHAELARKRLQSEQTLAALNTFAAQSAPLAHASHRQRFRVGEAAMQVDVRVSALHFWEQQGLLHPERDKSSRYRLYDEQQMRRVRVVALMREAGYNFSAIHTVLDELAAGHPEMALAAVEKRRAEIARTSWFCLVAMSSFYQYISVFWEDQAKTILAIR